MELDQLLNICKTEAKANKLETEELKILCDYATDQYNKKIKMITIINNIHYKVKEILKLK